ncbi:MAG TPA: sigma 54-interacting transcriptional regulator, partial [Bacteroidota bacterium]|nr:sigma 54-interacting transcriptional regulator [Bacteroidota bacterium]
AKLLRVLESREVLRVGGTSPVTVDVRLITATKVDLKELVEKNLFRSDLYYRINVVPIVIPPLRDRPDDIPLLVHHFLQRYAPGREIRVKEPAMRMLTAYPWPGNVRELRNAVQRMSLFVRDEIDCNDLPAEIREENPLELIARACSRCFVEENLSFDQVVGCLETNLLRQALQRTKGNRTQAAKLLGLSLSTLRDKLKRYNLDGDARFP